jgi:hypothetical protein
MLISRRHHFLCRLYTAGAHAWAFIIIGYNQAVATIDAENAEVP